MSAIHSRAMLASLSIGRWSAERHDRAISREVAQSHGTTEDVGRYQKKLSASPILTDIKNAESQARQRHYALTLPWGDDGARILPASLFFDHTKAMNACSQQFWEHAHRLFDNWDAIIAQEKIRLRYVDETDRGMFNAPDYPSLDELKAKYSFKVNILPLPQAEDFRVSISAEEEERIRQEITQTVTDSLGAASRVPWERLFKAVKHMADGLQKYDATKQEKGSARLYDSMTENLVELVEILPKLNITQDEALDKMAAEVRESLCGVKSQELRDSGLIRQQTAQKAEAILQKMKGYWS